MLQDCIRAGNFPNWNFYEVLISTAGETMRKFIPPSSEQSLNAKANSQTTNKEEERTVSDCSLHYSSTESDKLQNG